MRPGVKQQQRVAADRANASKQKVQCVLRIVWRELMQGLFGDRMAYYAAHWSMAGRAYPFPGTFITLKR